MHLFEQKAIQRVSATNILRLSKSPDANCSEPRNANVRKDTDSHIFVKENLFGFPDKSALKLIN
jgi:hypothetical protein